MSAWSLLLRIVLSLTLVMNGAMAVQAMPHSPTSMSQANSTRGESAAMPMHDYGQSCHGHRMAAHPHSATHDGAPAAHGASHSGNTCCTTGTCQCACVQAAQVVHSSIALGLSIFAPQLHDAPLRLGHASPALPHLIRPPIG
jgi:hypothetical protein